MKSSPTESEEQIHCPLELRLFSTAFSAPIASGGRLAQRDGETGKGDRGVHAGQQRLRRGWHSFGNGNDRN